jgi:hypothetical protein
MLIPDATEEETTMHTFLRYFAAVAIVAALLSVPFIVSSAGTSTKNISVIVEFKGDPAAVHAAKAKQSGALLSDDQIQAYRNSLTASQDKFLNSLKSSGISFQLQAINVKDTAGNVAGSVALRYSLVYNGLTLTVPEAAVPAIANMDGVKKVHANGVLHPDLFKSVPYIRATDLFGKDAQGKVLENNLLPHGADYMPTGNEGQGIYISVIDTGIDWTHEMFGGDPTPPRLGVAPSAAAVNTNPKVVYQLPLADVITDGFGHGTHVASTAGGYLGFAPGRDGLPNTADDIRVFGVAPQAKLMSYKVCSDALSTVGGVTGAVGGCLTSNIVMAIEDSVSPRTVTGQAKPVADVINMSLGGGGGPDEPTAVASDNATLMNCAVVAAAGNDGPAEDTLGAPAAGRRVIAVAASNDPGAGNNTVDVTDGSRTGMNAFILGGSAAVTADISNNYVFCGLGEKPADFPAAVAGKIALIQRGSTISTPAGLPASAGTGLFAVKANNAAAAGAVAAVIFNNVDGELTAATTYKTAIPALGLSKANGDFLMSIIGSNPLGLSAKTIRINKALSFNAAMADFSSRGPVQGYGQVKPDVAAPGVSVLAAAPPASALALLAAGADGVNYIAINGTSMATPHTAGAVALIKQAHRDWTPDMVRTALINTATNGRTESQVAKADGPGADSIITQGAGLIDVYHAVNAKALMGATETDKAGSYLLGSHSYGEVPVVNNRVTSTQSVTVTIKDLSGQGGTYNVGVANNRDLQVAGITVTTSNASVSVPAGGTATLTVNTTFDGNLIRDPNVAETIVNGTTVTFVSRPIQMQWYVTAQRADGGESLRMPFYYKPVFSQPAIASIDSETFHGTVAAGDLGAELAPGRTYVDVPFEVGSTTFKLDATLEFTSDVDGLFPDLDLFLLDSDGNVVDSSIRAGGPENISTAITPGSYTYRVGGYLAANTSFDLTSSQAKGHNAVPPVMQSIVADFANAQGDQVDFDGNINLSWTPHGGEQGFEIEHSADDKDAQGNPIPDDQKTWDILADVGSTVTSYTANGHSNGKHFFRVRAIYPGQIGMFVTGGSNSSSVLVDQRSKVDITTQITRAISNVSLSGGVFQLDLTIANNSAQNYVPLVDLNIVGITSGSNTVKVINADNSQDGKSVANAALFGYSQKIGSDEIFSASEVTAPRTVQFQDSASEMFTFDAVVTAYVSTGGGSSSSSSSSSSQQSSSGSSGSGLLPLTQLKAVLRFTANPLTKTVTAQLVSLK